MAELTENDNESEGLVNSAVAMIIAEDALKNSAEALSSPITPADELKGAINGLDKSYKKLSKDVEASSEKLNFSTTTFKTLFKEFEQAPIDFNTLNFEGTLPSKLLESDPVKKKKKTKNQTGSKSRTSSYTPLQNDNFNLEIERIESSFKDLITTLDNSFKSLKQYIENPELSFNNLATTQSPTSGFSIFKETYSFSAKDTDELKILKERFNDAFNNVSKLNNELATLKESSGATATKERILTNEIKTANRTLEHARIAIKNYYKEADIEKPKRSPIMDSLYRFEENSISRRNITGYASRFMHNWLAEKNSRFAHIGGKQIDDGSGKLQWVGGVNIGGSSLTAISFTLNKIFKWAVQYGKESMRAFGEIESIKTNLSVVYGSESLANNTFNEVAQYAVKSPFGVQQMTEFAILLKQSGVESLELMKTLKQIGDVAGGNQEKFQRIANNYAQIIAANKATSLDLRQFANAGLPIYKEIRKELNISQKEVREMTREGLVGADVIKKVFENMTSEGGSFYNSVLKGSQTYKARMQNMSDIKQLNLADVGQWIYDADPFGDSINSFFKDTLGTLEDIYSVVGTFFKHWNQDRNISHGFGYEGFYNDLLERLNQTNDPTERKKIRESIHNIEKNFNSEKFYNTKADKYDEAVENLRMAAEQADYVNKLYTKMLATETSDNEKRAIEQELKDAFGIDTKRANYYGALSGTSYGLGAVAGGIAATSAVATPATGGTSAIPAVGAGIGAGVLLGAGFITSLLSQHYVANADTEGAKKSAQKEFDKLNKDSSLKAASDARKAEVLVQNAYSQLKLNDNLSTSMLSLKDKFDELYKTTDAYKAEQAKLTAKTIEQLKEAKALEAKYGVKGPDYSSTNSGDFEWISNYGNYLKKTSATSSEKALSLLNQVKTQYSAGDPLVINTQSLLKNNEERKNTYNILSKNAAMVEAVFTQLGNAKDNNAYKIFKTYNSVLQGAEAGGDFNRKDLEKLNTAMAIAKKDIEGLESSEYKDLLMKLFAELTHVTLTDADISAIEKQNSLLPFYKRVLGDTLGIPEDVLRAAVKTNQMGSGQRLVDFYKKSNYRNENLAMSKALLNSGMSAKDVAGIYASATGGAVTDTIEKTRKINQEDANKALKNFAMSLGSASTVTQALADQYSTELEQLDNLFAAAAFKMEDAGMVLNEENASKLGYTKKDMEALVEDINAFNSQVVKNEDGTVTFNEKTLEAADALREFIKSEKIAAQELSSMKKIIEDNNKAIRDSREKSAIYGSAAGYTGSNSWERLSRENQNNLIQKVNNEALAKDVNGNYVNEALKKAVNDGTITAAIQYVAKNDIAPEGFEDVKVGGQAFVTWAKKLLESQNKVQDAERRSSLSEFTSQALDASGGKAMYDYNQAGIVYRERNSELVKYYNLIQEANDSIKDVEDINEKIYKEGLKYYQDSIKESQKRQKALEAERVKIQNKKGISDDERSLLLDVNYDDSIEEQGNERLIRQSMLEYQTAYAKETESLYGKRLETDYHINELTKAREVVEKEKLEAAEKMNLQEIEHTPNLKKALYSSFDPFNFFSTTDFDGNVVSSWGNNSGRQQTAMNALGYSGRDITRFSKDVLSNPDAQQNVKLNLLNAASYAGFDDKSITDIASQIDEAFKSNDFEGLNKLIEKLGIAKDATDNINKAALSMSNSLNTAFKSSLLNYANNSFQQIGKNLRDGEDASHGLYKMWKQTSSELLGSIGATMTQTGLTIAAEAAKEKKWSSVAGGLALAAAGGVANIASGFLSDGGSDKSKDDEAQKIQNLKDALSDLIDQAKTDAEYYQKNLMHKNALAANAQISTRSVNDAIITPNGSVVTTHPDDYLIATKTPDKLLGAAQNGANGTQVVLQVNPVVINQSSANVTTKTETKENADGSLDIITVIIDAVNSGLASGQLDEGMAAYQYNQQGRSVAM